MGAGFPHYISDISSLWLYRLPTCWGHLEIIFHNKWLLPLSRNYIWERFTKKHDFAWFRHAENEVLTSLGYKVIEALEPITFLESWDEAGSFKNGLFWRKTLSPCNELGPSRRGGGFLNS